MPVNKPRHILVIRLSAMGDVAMTVPVLLALKSSYPHLNITVLTRPFFEPVLDQIPGLLIYRAEVDGRHKGIPGIIKLFRELKALHVEGVADLHNVLRSNLLKLLFKFNNTRFVQIDKGRAAKKQLTAGGKKNFSQLKTMHRRYADVFEEFGYQINLEDVTLLPRQARSENIVSRIGTDDKKWVGIAPFAAYPGKCYPSQMMEDVLATLSKTERYKIILFGGPGTEREQLEDWESRFKSCISVPGQFTFAEELALISNLDLMVSMDSANGHLAANYGIPVLTLWGLTHPFAGFSPFRQNPENSLLADRTLYPAIPTSVYGNKMPAGYESVMETIAPATVVTKILELLH